MGFGHPVGSHEIGDLSSDRFDNRFHRFERGGKHSGKRSRIRGSGDRYRFVTGNEANINGILRTVIAHIEIYRVNGRRYGCRNARSEGFR
ncbi:MAG: hypothetical protein QG650_925 [Patescibacteria group bacterium]|nr:hypothetical protein [Patescibacteria group bacterium]